MLKSALVLGALSSVNAYQAYNNEVPNGNQFGIELGGPHGGNYNQFALDQRAAGHPNGWLKFCQKDSDKDGQTNGQELGDPCCTWTIGAAPLLTTKVTHPGDATKLSTPPNICPTAVGTPTPTPTPPIGGTPTPIGGGPINTPGVFKDGKFTMNYSHSGDTLTITMSAPVKGYLAVGFGDSHSTMDTYYGWCNSNGTPNVEDYYITDFTAGAKDAVQSCFNPSCTNVNGIQTVTFSRKLNTNDVLDTTITAAPTIVSYAFTDTAPPTKVMHAGLDFGSNPAVLMMSNPQTGGVAPTPVVAPTPSTSVPPADTCSTLQCGACIDTQPRCWWCRQGTVFSCVNSLYKCSTDANGNADTRQNKGNCPALPPPVQTNPDGTPSTVPYIPKYNGAASVVAGVATVAATLLALML